MSKSTTYRYAALVMVLVIATFRFWHPRPEEVHFDTLVIMAVMTFLASEILKALGK